MRYFTKLSEPDHFDYDRRRDGEEKSDCSGRAHVHDLRNDQASCTSILHNF